MLCVFIIMMYLQKICKYISARDKHQGFIANISNNAFYFLSLQTDIQEFYEVTLLNSQKSYEQKIEEANEVAEKWEKTTSPATGHENLQKSQEVTGQIKNENMYRV